MWRRGGAVRLMRRAAGTLSPAAGQMGLAVSKNVELAQ